MTGHNPVNRSATTLHPSDKAEDDVEKTRQSLLLSQNFEIIDL